MRCPSCQKENRENARFCCHCGFPLEHICPNCRHVNDRNAQFCDECGTKLTKEVDTQVIAVVSEPQSTQSAAADASRRQLTVMFCDLVGSTSLSEKLDPEELRGIIRDYQDVCASEINRYEGHIAQYLGDGILVYFGYPQAHEDDARRAVKAGLGIVEAVGQLNRRQEPLGGVQLKVRVVVHTGLVVVGEIGGGERFEQLALGETPNIAAKIEGLAEANTVVISDATHRLVEGFFHFHDLGTYDLEGISRPVNLYHVLHEGTAKSRIDAAVVTGLTPMVGREQELDLLLTHWEGAKAGEGHVLLLHGEPGVGKSRLVRTLKEHISRETDSWFTECRCSPYYRNSAFYPVIDMLERTVLHFTQEDSSKEKLGKLEECLGGNGFELEQMMPLFSSLLSIPVDDRYAPLHLTADRQKRKTIEAILMLWLRRSEKQPVLLVVEDLHWVDPSTLELIDLLIEQEPTNRLLVLLTFRPEFIPTWGIRPHLTPISLRPLPHQLTRAIVEYLTRGKALPGEVLEQIVQKTDGVPLFVEELTKMILESGLLKEKADRYELVGPLPPLAIPTTLQDSLIARLDRLSAGKEVAQLGGTLGREFTYELIRAVSLFDESTLQDHLGKLVSAGLLYQRGVPPESIYQFKHALVRDTAYESLLTSTRKQYHQRIAQVLVEEFPEVAEVQPELVAQHYTMAGLNEEAVPYWHHAGQRAIERSANVEAITHLKKGLELLKGVKDTPVKVQRELDLQTALGNVLMITDGFGTPEVKQALERARKLCQLVRETPQLFTVLHGLWIFNVSQANMDTTLELAEECLALAERLQDTVFLLEAHHAIGTTYFFLGEFISAKTHYEQCYTLHDSQPSNSRVVFPGREDPGVVCKAHAAHVLWLLGYSDQAMERMNAAMNLAQSLSHPFSIAFAHFTSALLHLLRRESKYALDQAEAAIAISEAQGFAFWEAWASVYWGWAVAMNGREEEGIGRLKEVLKFLRATGNETLQPHARVLLAEAYGRVGIIEKGLAELDKAEVTVVKKKVGFYEIETHRMRGELLLLQSSPDEKGAEIEFRKAIEVARRQQAKSLELRATVSLSRLLLKMGKKEEAHSLLTEIYGWFTEGFETVDLIEAKKCLDELM